MRCLITVLAVFTAWSALALADSVNLDLPSGYDQAERTILPGNLLADVSTVAGDAFKGRGPGSEGDRKARQYLAGRLADIGFEPLFEKDSWEQEVEIVGLTVENPSPLEFKAGNGSSERFSYGDEYMIMSGLQQNEISVGDAEVVFVGYGIEAPAQPACGTGIGSMPAVIPTWHA